MMISSGIPVEADPAAGTSSRRDALQSLGRLAAGGLMAMTAPACAKPIQQTGEDDDAYVARLLLDADPHIPYRAAPYRLRRTVMLPAGRIVSIDPRTRIVWEGPKGDAQALVGVFEAAGDDAGIIVSGGEAMVECAMASPFVYAAMMREHQGFVVTGLQGRECGHVFVGPRHAYAEIRLDGTGINASRRIRITGGGASYAQLQPLGHGACYLGYVVDCQVRGARYRNVPNGVQWWGGNADPVRPPAEGGSINERKCRDVLIEHVSVDHVAGAGIWGAMGRNITVRDCAIAEIGDVGFDAEGCTQVVFERCTARNARNGCFTTFFLCNGVRFVNCTGIVDDKAFPLVRVYNESQTNWDNKGLEVVGGTFECRDRTGPSTIDTAMGPVGTLAITGATLKNVRIDVAHSNMHRTVISRNTLDFPYPLGSLAAITAGSSKSLQQAPTVVPGTVTVTDNRIRYTAAPRAGDAAIGIALREDDFNSSAVDTVRGNHVSGPFRTGVSLTSASLNIGIVPSFTIAANRFDGSAGSQPLLVVVRESPASRQPTVNWDAAQTRNGMAVPLARALR